MTSVIGSAMVIVEQIGRVRRLTIDRPEVRNALSAQCCDELVVAVLDAQDDPATRVVVIRAAGPDFSSGYEIAGITAQEDESLLEADLRFLRSLERRWAQVLHAEIPVIASVHGHCLAGSTDLVSHCDLVIVAEDAVIGYPPVRSMGVPPMQMWIYHLGPQWAKRLLLTGDTFTGVTAARIGFALEAVPAEDLDAHTLALAERMALVGTSQLRGNKFIVNFALELMGRGQLQQLSAMSDAISHQSAGFADFVRTARERGVRTAVAERDAPFGDQPPL